jgi:urease accessory protein
LTASVARDEQVQAYDLDIALVRDTTGRTHIGGQYVAYPFHLCRALRTLGDPVDMPTLYIQSCSGGIFEGDDLRCRLRIGPGARAHITTAASTVVHSMESGTAAQQVDIEVAADAFIEYLPDPMILFPGASLRNGVSIRLGREATAIAWDSFLSHDPKASGAVFRDFTSVLDVTDEAGNLLARDRYCAQGEVFRQATPGVMGSHRVQAGFVLLRKGGPVAQWTEGLRECMDSGTQAYIGISALPNEAGVWVRMLAPDTAILREALGKAWARAREMVTGVAPVPRRK